METERFCVPELLFHPGDIGRYTPDQYASSCYSRDWRLPNACTVVFYCLSLGIDQAGAPETTWQALQQLDQVRRAPSV